MLKNKNLLDSFNRAAKGIIFCLRTQRNFRIHLLAALLVLFSSLWFHITKEEFLLVLTAIFLVLVAEIINTAIEVTIDLITRDYHPLAAVAKNVAAGGVMLTAVMAVVIGYIVFFPRVNPLIPKIVEILRNSPVYLTFIALALVIVVVVIFKTGTGKGLSFSGGMPSGHTALGFASATAIILLSGDGLIAALALFISILLAESRVEAKIHTPFEVIIGGLLGILLTLLFFQLHTQLG